MRRPRARQSGAGGASPWPAGSVFVHTSSGTDLWLAEQAALLLAGVRPRTEVVKAYHAFHDA